MNDRKKEGSSGRTLMVELYKVIYISVSKEGYVNLGHIRSSVKFEGSGQVGRVVVISGYSPELSGHVTHK